MIGIRKTGEFLLILCILVAALATPALAGNVQPAADSINVNKVPVLPVAAFNGSPRTSGAVPLIVHFTDASTMSPTSWLWDFGDGNTSIEQNPTHTYSAFGTYTVNLTATNADGTNTVSKPGYIAVLTPQPITGPIYPYNFINLHVANDKGVYYDSPNGIQGGTTYHYVPNTYFLAMYGGMNSEHMSTDPANPAGQVSTTTNTSGTFWIAQTGGQPTMYDTIVMLAVNGTIPDDFSLHIRSSGYKWAMDSPATTNSVTPSVYSYSDGEVNETFTKSDFIYGPQTWKPGSVANYPIYYGQNMSDTNNTFMIMFVDLGVGALKQGVISPQIDNGAAKVEYDLHGLTSSNVAVFDVNSWYSRSNRGTGIKDTNSVDDSARGASGLSVIVPAAPVPAPVAALPGVAAPPTDLDGDGWYEDVNGNGQKDFADVVQYFNQMDWIAANEPVEGFDFNGNGRIDFADVVALFLQF